MYYLYCIWYLPVQLTVISSHVLSVLHLIPTCAINCNIIPCAICIAFDTYLCNSLWYHPMYYLYCIWYLPVQFTVISSHVLSVLHLIPTCAINCNIIPCTICIAFDTYLCNLLWYHPMYYLYCMWYLPVQFTVISSHVLSVLHVIPTCAINCDFVPCTICIAVNTHWFGAIEKLMTFFAVVCYRITMGNLSRISGHCIHNFWLLRTWHWNE